MAKKDHAGIGNIGQSKAGECLDRQARTALKELFEQIIPALAAACANVFFCISGFSLLAFWAATV